MRSISMPRIKVFILLIFTAAILAFYTIDRGPSYKVSAQTASEKTVGETHPNVKLLKDLPESQLQITMNFMRASLGVTGASPHVVSPEEKWVFSKDKKPLKETARK